MANVGYERVSSVGQNTERQLQGVEIDKLFTEKCSAKTIERPVLEDCIDWCREGDMLHIHSLDRVCRSGAGDAVALVERLLDKSVGVTFHKEGMIFSGKITAAQKGVLSILASVAEMERGLIQERRDEGIALAKEKGKYRGRKPALNNEELDEFWIMLGDGYTAGKLAKHFGIGRATAYRIAETLKKERDKKI